MYRQRFAWRTASGRTPRAPGETIASMMAIPSSSADVVPPLDRVRNMFYNAQLLDADQPLLLVYPVVDD